jgi:aryl-alcohol dehydrogenase-like predicted oxidoreductase
VALTPWSPLARGILAGTYQGGFGGGSTNRSQGQDVKRTQSLYHGEHVFPVAERVIEVAAKYEKKPAQIAVAWLMNKAEVTSPIVGVSKVAQLTDLVEAASVEIEAEDMVYLEELYQPVENLLSIGTS